MIKYILLTLILFTSYAEADVKKVPVSLFIEKKLEISALKYEQPIEFKFGKPVGHEGKQDKWWNLLAVNWWIINDREITFDAYSSQFDANAETLSKMKEHFGKTKQKYPTKKDALDTSFSRNFSSIVLYGYTIFDIDGEEYLVPEFKYKSKLDEDGYVYKLFVKKEGTWKKPTENIELPIGHTPPGTLDEMLKWSQMKYLSIDKRGYLHFWKEVK